MQGSSFGRPCIACTYMPLRSRQLLVLSYSRFPTLFYPLRVWHCQVFKRLDEASGALCPRHVCNVPRCRFKHVHGTELRRYMEPCKTRTNKLHSVSSCQGRISQTTANLCLPREAIPNTLIPAIWIAEQSLTSRLVSDTVVGGSMSRIKARERDLVPHRIRRSAHHRRVKGGLLYRGLILLLGADSCRHGMDGCDDVPHPAHVDFLCELYVTSPPCVSLTPPGITRRHADSGYNT